MGELDLELTQMDSFIVHMDVVVKRLEAIGKNDPRIVRLRTIPGVGPRTAEILVACIDDPHRLENGRQVSAYFRLVPRQYQSGETVCNGRITLCCLLILSIGQAIHSRERSSSNEHGLRCDTTLGPSMFMNASKANRTTTLT